ncbi:MAG: hypothetical protein K8T90_04455 [Planctomycetes bacterium]|nr:hypothetical protein [Planctomycetota bacterium]
MSAAPRTTLLHRVRAGLVLVVALFVLLETLRYFTTAMWRQQFEVLPSVGVTKDGAPVYWAWRMFDEGPLRAGYEGNLYDGSRHPTEWTTTAPTALRECVATAWFGQPQMEDSPLYRSGSYGPPWMPIGRWSASRREILKAPQTLPLASSMPYQVGGVLGAHWRSDDGRMVLRGPDRKVMGGFGPDGWVAGPDGVGGERFIQPFSVGLHWTMPSGAADGRTTMLVVDSKLREAFFVRSVMSEAGKPQPATKPDWISVSRLPLDGDGPIRPLSAYAAGSSPFAVLVGDEIVTFTVDGRVRSRAPAEPDAAPLATFGGAWPVAPRGPDAIGPIVVATTPAPVSVIGARMRFRVFDTDKPPVVTDVDLSPVTGAEHAMAWGRRLLAIVRPPVLSAASFATAAPANYEAMFSTWLTDPLYAGGSETLTLAICLLLGAACAVRARRQARLRVPAAGAVRFWTASAFLLGPVGLVWMRIVIPKQALMPCACGASRAVSVETCSACAASWPTPKPTGIEVFAARAERQPA